ncbi:MAG: diaminopimelate epimerase [Thiobacillaceae bacterium]|jgi:diaminopimelate epimerase|nr:diaminopimelate epimerase [Thiobacillaceae bacterium]
MRLQFTKMHGLGNDFVVFDGIHQQVALTPAQLRHLADRHFGVGCDQILLVEAPTRPDVDFRYRIFNADGGEVSQCGNGARCFVRFVHERGLTTKRAIRVETASGVIVPCLEADGQVTVDMGPPRFAPADIPFDAPERRLTYDLEVGGRRLEISALSMGNPHAVWIVDDVHRAPVAELGPLIEYHPRFPERVNAGFLQLLSRREALLRVHERGSGETLSCGTGACAAAVAGMTRGLLDAAVTVHTRGGELIIRWSGADNPVYMTGPAATVYQGEIEL